MIFFPDDQCRAAQRLHKRDLRISLTKSGYYVNNADFTENQRLMLGLRRLLPLPHRCAHQTRKQRPYYFYALRLVAGCGFKKLLYLAESLGQRTELAGFRVTPRRQGLAPSSWLRGDTQFSSSDRPIRPGA